MTWAFFVVLAVVGGLLLPFAATTSPASALTGSDFDPGSIISDGNFYNANAMSEAEIQRFLESKVGTCANSNCLPLYRENTPTRTWGFGTCSTYVGGAAESAARIIFKVQQACNLSAKVILVTLQKEQGLVTDRDPSDGVMRKAMGYGCPDTSTCDSTYYGFFNQIFAAGRQLTWYSNPGGSFTSIRIGQVNAIRLHPNADCGSMNVLVKNKATAALYYYTPYTPNAAALANLGGTGNSCSSYGNRNFWVYYNNWFGPTQGPDGAALIAAEYAAQGGAASLGAPISGVLTIPQNGGGLGQAFANGSIYWSAFTGAVTVRDGTIRGYYFNLGGAAGSVGWPTANQASISENGGGTAQAFTGGSIYSSSAGTYLVTPAAQPGYFAQTGAAGRLGWPKADQICGIPGGGCSQAFQSGTVFWMPGQTSYAIYGPILAAYTAAGSTGGAWGQPVSDLVAIPSGTTGFGQAFAAGSAYVTGNGPVLLVSGAIRDLYFQQNGASGSLGFPTSSRRCDLPGGECTQAFQYGSIIESKAGVARVASPEIEAAYAANGGVGGKLGGKTSGLIYYAANGGGLAQAYAGGSIFWKGGVGAFAVTSPTREAYFAIGGSAGTLGWPVQAAQCTSSVTCVQGFEGGSVYSSSRGSFAVGGSIRTGYVAAGGPTGAWGVVASTLIGIGSGGGGQVFANGSAYYSASAPARFVSGAIRDGYFSLGGATGPLGFPNSDARCDLPRGGCSQDFEGGSVYASQTAGTQVVFGAIKVRYTAAGGPSGAWGLPTSSEVPINGPRGTGSGQAFENVSVYRLANGSPFVVSGSIRQYYFTRAGAAGDLGFPVGDETCGLPGSGCSQPFQGGTVYWSLTTGASVVSDRYLTKYTQSGGPAGPWGMPVSALLIVPDGSGQAFQNASAYSADVGPVYAVSGPIRDYYFARAGAAGPLGLPTSDLVCAPDGVCTQKFGAVSLTASKAGVVAPG